MKIVIIGFLLLFCSTAMAQDIEVKSMKQVKPSTEAGARKDLNDVTCGLLRVKMDENGAQFEGNIIGDVAYTGGEYRIYMTKGSKRISIKHPNYLPITILFSDYRVSKLESGAEYVMTTKLHKEKQKADPKKRGIVVFTVNPTSATLAIDGKAQDYDAGGAYTASLPYGTHYYSVTYDNFTIDNQVVRVDKEPKAVNVDLTEFCPWIQVKTEDDDADIYINDILRGTGQWEGLITPGEHVIQIRKEGYHTQSQTVMLQENQFFNVHFDKMNVIAGSLKVDYEPIGAEVFLDGKKVGVTPLELKTVKPGRHQLKIRKEFCKDSLMRPIMIIEDQELNIKGSLSMTYWAELLNEAAQGDACAMHMLGTYYSSLWEDGYGWEAGWCESCYRRFTNKCHHSYNGVEERGLWNQEELPPNYHTSIFWLKKALDGKSVHKGNPFNACIMTAISICYAHLKQYDESFRWAKQCVDTYKSGNNFLAWHYYYGRGTPQNLALAKKYFKSNNSNYDSIEKIENSGFPWSFFYLDIPNSDEIDR